MTPKGQVEGPGRATTPAFSYPVTRQFDGGLLRRWTFVLTHRDALACLRLRREWPNHFKVALGLICFAGGALWGLLPAEKGDLLTFLATESLLVGGVFLGRDLLRQRRARRMVPHPRPGVLEEWVDCIAGTEVATGEDTYISPELIGEVLLTRTHLFVRSHADTITVPITAFASPAEAKEVADHIRALSRGPYYFDAPLDDDPQAL